MDPRLLTSCLGAPEVPFVLLHNGTSQEGTLKTPGLSDTVSPLASYLSSKQKKHELS